MRAEAVLALVTAGSCRTELRTAKPAADGGDPSEKGQSGWALTRRNGCEGVDQLLTQMAKGQGSSGMSVPVAARNALRLERRILNRGGGEPMRSGRKISESKSLLKLADRSLALTSTATTSGSGSTLQLPDRVSKTKTKGGRSGRKGKAASSISGGGRSRRSIVPKATI